MKEKIILAIESSCDETSVSIIKGDVILSNATSSQIEKHRVYGGVVPELASREHLNNFDICLKEALSIAKVSLSEVDAFAFTRGPGLVGALQVGLQVAKTLATLYNKPLIPVHHLAAHIYVAEVVKQFTYPLMALLVSGGNTEIVYIQSELHFEVIGSTKDDALGECFDKVARVLGLPYPGGIEIDKRAKLGNPCIKLPTPLKNDGTFDLSYSGLKTHVINYVNSAKMRNEEIEINDLCASFQKVAVEQVLDKFLLASIQYNVKQAVIAGGVSANSYLRSYALKQFQNNNIDLIVPPLWSTGDQAGMIAKIATSLDKRRLYCDLSIGVDPNWEISDFDKF